MAVALCSALATICFINALRQTDIADVLVIGATTPIAAAALLGAHILQTEPGLFQAYIRGSPSFWFADRAIYGFEVAYARQHQHLGAEVLLHVSGLEISRYDAGRKGSARDMVAGLQEFASRLFMCNYSGLQLYSTAMFGKDHISSVRPGFAWAVTKALLTTALERQ